MTRPLDEQSSALSLSLASPTWPTGSNDDAAPFSDQGMMPPNSRIEGSTYAAQLRAPADAPHSER